MTKKIEIKRPVGRPENDYETVILKFSVPAKYKEIIKKLVKKKLTSLKNREKRGKNGK